MDADTPPTQILIVLDPHFGAALNQWVAVGPAWLCESPENRAAAEGLWTGTRLPPDQVTIFEACEGSPAERRFLAILGDVCQHHPDWSCLEVVGCAPTPHIKAALTACGDGRLEDRPNGFAFARR